MEDSRANGVLFGANGLIHPGDIVQSLVPNHGDFRLLAAKRAVMQGRGSGVADSRPREYPTFVAHPNYGLKGYPAGSFADRTEAGKKSAISRAARFPGFSNDFGYFTKDPKSTDLKLRPEYMPDFPIKPWEEKVQVKLVGDLSVAEPEPGRAQRGTGNESADE